MFSIIILIGILFIYWFLNQNDSQSMQKKISNHVKQVLKIQSNPKSPFFGGNTFEENNAKPNSNLSSEEIVLSQLNENQLKNWILLQSEGMDSTDHDTEEVDLKLRAQAKTIRSEQLPHIISLAIDFHAPANARILSGYLLALTQTSESTKFMKILAEQALPDLGPILPHSESELRRSHELALRYMQVDELSERAKTDSNARDNLFLLSQSAKAEEVRKYAASKLKSLK
jgi:hypothetical protein